MYLRNVLVLAALGGLSASAGGQPPEEPVVAASPADEAAVLARILGRKVLPDGRAQEQLQAFCWQRIPRFEPPPGAEQWAARADQLRERLLSEVVFRGAAQAWRTGQTRCESLDVIPRPGYRIEKLRYEAVPGLWIPALLYVPDPLPAGPTPVYLALHGHAAEGLVADYKQKLCVNLVRRGMLVLSLEWVGMGQLRTEGLRHDWMNLLDLCGTSGLSVFVLSIQRGLDVLLAHPLADSQRVAVSGLSGGGWQTICAFALDERFTLANPVAGHSSLLTRAEWSSDLGDSEQMPTDLARFADYTHLTALRAPAPLLLTYNADDDCCFKSYYALPPLEDAVRPLYARCGAESAFATHINYAPGNHNYEQDNREAFYAFLRTHFFAGSDSFPISEAPADDEVLSAEQLFVPLPEDNATFWSLAQALAQDLPRDGWLPAAGELAAWQAVQRDRLAQIVRSPNLAATAGLIGREQHGALAARHWRLQAGPEWTLPAVSLEPGGTPAGTTLLLCDSGRSSLVDLAGRELLAGRCVVAVDLAWLGETAQGPAWQMALLANCVGERPLGQQAAQVVAAAQWAAREFGGPLRVVARGPRATLATLVACASQSDGCEQIELHDCRSGLRQAVLRPVRHARDTPELYCFGLLEHFDLCQLAAMSAPRQVEFCTDDPLLREQIAPLDALYESLTDAAQAAR